MTDGDTVVVASGHAGPGVGSDAVLGSCGVPPVRRPGIARVQTLALAAARSLLGQVDLPERVRARTGVVVSTCLPNARQRRNAARVGAVEAVLRSPGPSADRRVSQIMAEHGATAQDRIGEMASSVPAQIAVTHGLHGRVLALEAAQAGAAAALWVAANALRAGSTAAEIVVVAQESQPDWVCEQWAARSGTGAGPWPEGAVAVLLTGSATAAAEGLPVLGHLYGVTLAHLGRPGTFRGPDPSTLPSRLAELVAGSAAPAERIGRVVLAPEVDAAGPPGATRAAVAARLPGAEISGGPPPATPRNPVLDGMLRVLAELTTPPPSRASPAVVVEASLTGTLAAVTVAPAGAAPPGATAAGCGELAVLGLGVAFGPARDPDHLHDLASRVRVFETLDAARLPPGLRSAGMAPGRSYCATGSVLAEPVPDDRDRLPPRRRDALGPLTGHVMAVAREALDGCADRPAGRGAVLVATTLGPGHARIGDPVGPPDPVALDGQLASGLAALVVNELGLDAVPVALEAACASGLAAVSVVADAVAAGALDYAIVVGAELPCNRRDLVLCSALGMLSPTSITPFAAGADGFTPGDGCGAVVLARPSATAALAVVRGTGGSCDGSSMLAPDRHGQQLALARAIIAADVDPDSVDLVETHGTGTGRGDACELQALDAVYHAGSRAEPLHLSAVKAAVGHTFAAAGIAGLARVVTALRRGVLPPLPGDPSPPPPGMRFLPAACPWPARPDHGRRAGVNSFGTGGINFHVVVEEAR